MMIHLYCVFILLILQQAVKSQHSNPHNFQLLINPEYSICNGVKNLFIMTYVHSAPANYKKREIIRQTWANTALFTDLRIVFVMGATKSRKVNDLLKLEQSIYGDLIQENFEDSYRNLTYKGIAALKWLSIYCDKKPKYILKVDDDVIINMFLLRQHLKRLDSLGDKAPKHSIMCYIYKRMKVVRNKKSKWYLSKDEFKDDRFKTYCSGAAFLITSDLVRPMFEASLEVPFFWIDDYYVTGLLAEAVKAKFQPLNSIYMFTPSVVKRAFVYKKPDSVVFGHFSHLNDTIDQMMEIWNFIKARFSFQIDF